MTDETQQVAPPAPPAPPPMPLPDLLPSRMIGRGVTNFWRLTPRQRKNFTT
jgi:hypothetical protein